MPRVRRKADKLVKRLRQAMPDANISVVHTQTQHGRSSYISYYFADLREKVRISDHPVGAVRFNFGEETLFLPVGFTRPQIARWFASLVKSYQRRGGQTPGQITFHSLLKRGTVRANAPSRGSQALTSARARVLPSRHLDEAGVLNHES